MPRLAIPVHLFIRNEVYANPDRIDFGTISLAQLEKSPDLLPYLTQTILIKRRQGEDFQIKVQSDLPFLQIVKTPDLGSTIYRLDISLVIEKLSRGKITGSIRILTNDRDFPELVIPVQGEVKMGENSVRYLNFQYKDITIYGVQTTTG